jgi:hypothetical protein
VRRRLRGGSAVAVGVRVEGLRVEGLRVEGLRRHRRGRSAVGVLVRGLCELLARIDVTVLRIDVTVLRIDVTVLRIDVTVLRIDVTVLPSAVAVVDVRLYARVPGGARG